MDTDEDGKCVPRSLRPDMSGIRASAVVYAADHFLPDDDEQAVDYLVNFVAYALSMADADR